MESVHFLFMSLTFISSWSSINGFALYILPSRTANGYLGDDLSLTCYHSADFLYSPRWLANGLELDSNSFPSVDFINQAPSFSFAEIVINDIAEEFNGTEIQCYEEGEIYSTFSNKVIILLQGIPSPVESLYFEVNAVTININWSPPFTLYGGHQILYNVEVLNKTSLQVQYYSTSDTYFTLHPAPSRLVICDDFDIAVTPRNKVGNGNRSEVFIRSKDISVSKVYTAASDNDQKVDILVEMNTFLCSISNVTITNSNLNHVTSREVFNSFQWYDDHMKAPRYLLTLQLEKRFLYEIQMTLKNNKRSITRNFNVSTHEVARVETSEMDGQVQVFLYYSNHTVGINGALVILAFCETPLCSSFNYTKSIVLSTYGSSLVTYRNRYYSGNYIAFAFDANLDGSVRSSASLINMAYSIPTYQFELISGSITAGESLPSDGNCTYSYNNKSLSSFCTTNKAPGEQQVVQIKSDFNNHQSLILSDLYPMNSSLCAENDQANYVISIYVNARSDTEDLEPLGRTLISADNYIDEVQSCTDSTVTEENYHGLVYLGVIVSLGLTLGLITSILILFIVKRKNTKYIVNLH